MTQEKPLYSDCDLKNTYLQR